MSTHRNPPDSAIRDLLAEARTIAVVGASSSPSRPSYGVMKRLLDAGYRVFPVNPSEAEVLGEKAFGTLDEVGEPIDVVDVFRRPEFTPEVAAAAVRVGAKVLWLQQGIWSEEAARIAREGGLEVVMDRCTAVDLALLRVPPKTANPK